MSSWNKFSYLKVINWLIYPKHLTSHVSYTLQTSWGQYSWSINIYRIAHFFHDDILKMDVTSDSRVRTRPTLDPNTISSTCNSAILDPDTLYRFFIWIFAQASNTDPMPRSAGHFVDIDVFATISKRNAIITCLYIWVCDVEPVQPCNMDSICVHTIARCINRKVIKDAIVTTP